MPRLASSSARCGPTPLIMRTSEVRFIPIASLFLKDLQVQIPEPFVYITWRTELVAGRILALLPCVVLDDPSEWQPTSNFGTASRYLSPRIPGGSAWPEN